MTLEAALTLAIALVGIAISVWALRKASVANRLSQDAISLQTERNDVEWDYDWVAPGHLRLTQIGEDEALDVTARVAVYDQSREDKRTVVRKGDHFDFDFPEVRSEVREHERAVRMHEEAEERGRTAQAQAHKLGLPAYHIPAVPVLPYYAPAPSGRVVWRTPRGTVRHEDL